MPHRCAGCNTLFPDARYLKDGCPVCGSGKFIYEKGTDRKETRSQKVPEKPLITAEKQKEKEIPDGQQESVHKEGDPDSIESIHILEPGRYDLNLSRLIESDDLVVKMGQDDNYRLDLHSMIRQKRKK
ncbi:MAG: hypothetical protein GXY48_09945 [Methanomicrobiales archaeon]|nr:hypothetical protein [Methanomicrobiales archaeon]